MPVPPDTRLREGFEVRREAGLALVLMAAVVAGCASRTTPVDSPASSPSTVAANVTDTPSPSPSPSPSPVSIYVGGAEVVAVPGASSSPAIDEGTATDVVRAVMAAGRATMIGTHADAPFMRITAVAFVPAIVRILGPSSSPDFEPADPVAAWVVASEGRGSDGIYLGVGVVGQDGTPLTVYIITPGVG